MKYIYVGKIVNTHGIKGELRILSDSKYKNEIFKINNYLYIDDKEYQIKTYRQHKNYDMVTLDDLDNINKVLHLKNKKVYTLRTYIKEILPEDLIGYKIIYEGKKEGKVISITKNKIQDILVTDNKKKVIFIKEIIKNIDNEKKEITVGGIFDEN